MEMSGLLSGIAVVIDDEVKNEEANIHELIKQINDQKIPCFTSTKLPEEGFVQHFANAAFIILDWKLKTEELSSDSLQGIRIPDVLDRANINESIEFLKTIRSCCFSPIFIFTNEDTENVINKLRENGLYQDDKPNFILVKRKSELCGDNLFLEIQEWIKETPAIYVLKKWEQEYKKAQNQLFLDFYNRSPYWPSVLWNSYKTDKTNESMELGDIITKNLYSRMAPFNFDESILKIEGHSDSDELRKVLEGERFIKVDQLNTQDIFTGDIYKTECDSWPYLLNIRAQCDLLRNRNPSLYCLKGRVIEESKIGNEIEFKQGEFIEKKHQAIISCIDDGKIIEFTFRNLSIVKWNKVKETRIGRLLPPFITRVQQLYSLYFQRIGLPRTPDEIFCRNMGQAAAATQEAAATKNPS